MGILFSLFLLIWGAYPKGPSPVTLPQTGGWGDGRFGGGFNA